MFRLLKIFYFRPGDVQESTKLLSNYSYTTKLLLIT